MGDMLSETEKNQLRSYGGYFVVDIISNHMVNCLGNKKRKPNTKDIIQVIESLRESTGDCDCKKIASANSRMKHTARSFAVVNEGYKIVPGWDSWKYWGTTSIIRKQRNKHMEKIQEILRQAGLPEESIIFSQSGQSYGRLVKGLKEALAKYKHEQWWKLAIKVKEFLNKNPKSLLSEKMRSTFRMKLVSKIPRYQTMRKPEDYVSEYTATGWTGWSRERYHAWVERLLLPKSEPTSFKGLIPRSEEKENMSWWTKERIGEKIGEGSELTGGAKPNIGNSPYFISYGSGLVVSNPNNNNFVSDIVGRK